MAYDITLTDHFSARPAYRILLYVRRQDQGSNSSVYAWEVRAQKVASGTTWSSTARPWSVTIGGQVFTGATAPDFRYTNDILMGSGYTGWFGHDGNGYLDIQVGAYYDCSAELFGVADIPPTWFQTDRIAQVPDPTTSLGVDQATATSLRYRFSAPADDGGAGIDGYQVQYSTASNFASATTINSGGTSTVTGLTPGTTYYFRSRAHNAVGWGGWSSTSSGATLAVTAPALTVTPLAIGSQTQITIVAPSNLNPPDTYILERRVQGSGTVITTTYPSGQVFPVTVTELTPGVTYEWRAAVTKGTYTSPYSSWIAQNQPAPNTNPGDYFDGATAAKPDVTYAWTGTAHLSASTENGVPPTGWEDFAGGNGVSGGTGAVYQVTGGASQSKSARVIFHSDCTAAGFFAGADRGATGRAAVAANGRYYGSAAVQIPGRAQRLAARIDWLTAAGAFISSTTGTAQVVAAGGTWTTLSATGVAPATAAFATVVVVDVTGTSWATWKGGDSFLIDSLLLTLGEPLPYFDGSTPDSAEFTYAWEGTVNASVSTRITLTQSVVDPLADPDCDPIPLPPTAPIIVDDCIISVGTWRRYWAILPPDQVSLWLAEIPTITLTTGAEPARQVRIRIYENPLDELPDTFVADTWVSEQIISYMPPNSVFVLDGVEEDVQASVDGADWRPANHLLYGSDGTPATWPVLSCGIGYLISFDVPLDAPEGNLTTQVALTQRM